MYNKFTQCSLRRAGHLNRLEESRLPKQIPYSQLWERSCKTGRIKLRYKDIIKRNVGVINIPLDYWQYLSKNQKTEGKIKQLEVIIGFNEQFVWLIIFKPLFVTYLLYIVHALFFFFLLISSNEILLRLGW